MNQQSLFDILSFVYFGSFAVATGQQSIRAVWIRNPNNASLNFSLHMLKSTEQRPQVPMWAAGGDEPFHSKVLSRHTTIIEVNSQWKHTHTHPTDRWQRVRPNPHRTRNATQRKWNLLMWMGVSTLHASNIKGKTFQFACASRRASCVDWALATPPASRVSSGDVKWEDTPPPWKECPTVVVSGGDNGCQFRHKVRRGDLAVAEKKSPRGRGTFYNTTPGLMYSKLLAGMFLKWWTVFSNENFSLITNGFEKPNRSSWTQ